MNYQEFQERYRGRKLFRPRDIRLRYPNFEAARLTEWGKKGYILKLRNGLYAFNSEKDALDPYFVANRIYEPSYVGLQSILADHGWIPEQVFSVTSVSVRKTKSFETPLGSFIFRTISPELFFGYELDAGSNVLHSSPMRGLLDLLWLEAKAEEVEQYLEGLRINWDLVSKVSKMGDWFPVLALFREKKKALFSAFEKFLERDVY